MCRLLAYLGTPVLLADALFEAPHSLEHQSWAPRTQRHGTINADGWGVGWYEQAIRAEPARYRTVQPMWTDSSFRSVAGVVRSAAYVAAVRSATVPSAAAEVNTPPFVAGSWLFAHNGAVPGWRDGLGETLRRAVSPARASSIEGSTDSEVLFALVLDGLDGGLPPGDALWSVVERVAAQADARLNLLLTDGSMMAATVWGDTLSIRRDPCGTHVASEPFDDDPSWEAQPDRSVLTLDPRLDGAGP